MKIAGKPVDFGVQLCGYMPLDVGTFAIDNSGPEYVLKGWGTTLPEASDLGANDHAFAVFERHWYQFETA